MRQYESGNLTKRQWHRALTEATSNGNRSRPRTQEAINVPISSGPGVNDKVDYLVLDG
jgi:hypothetical protein